MFRDTGAFQEINLFYMDTVAKRSGLPHINHIVEGCELLESIGADIDTIEAFCIHPLIQNDMGSRSVDSMWTLALAHEYSDVANTYLCKPDTDYINTPDQLDELLGYVTPQVLQMLYADKIQNNKDFLAHHMLTHDRRIELARYFSIWICYLSDKLFNKENNEPSS
jgi:hypothetical protein